MSRVVFAEVKNSGKLNVKYFADPQNRDLAIIKQKQKPNIKLIVAPFPNFQGGTDQFFLQFSQSLSTQDLQP